MALLNHSSEKRILSVWWEWCSWTLLTSGPGSDSGGEVRQFLWYSVITSLFDTGYFCSVFSEVFSSLVFSVSAKEGNVSLGRWVDRYPGDSIHKRWYFWHCFLPNTGLDFPFPWTLGSCIHWFVVDRYSYTDRTAQALAFYIHFALCWNRCEKVEE